MPMVHSISSRSNSEIRGDLGTPQAEVIDAIVAMKRHHPRYGCPRMDQYTRRIIGFAVHAGNVDGPALCRMFNDATARQGWPKYLSSENDPLVQYHRWKANLRVLDIEEIKSLPHVPMSHPFVERLIGSVRRELLDQTLFWTATDLENKLQDYQCYYNEHRTHSGRDGTTPVGSGSEKVADINSYRWKKHCRGQFQLPEAA